MGYYLLRAGRARSYVLKGVPDDEYAHAGERAIPLQRHRDRLGSIHIITPSEAVRIIETLVK